MYRKTRSNENIVIYAPAKLLDVKCFTTMAA